MFARPAIAAVQWHCRRSTLRAARAARRSRFQVPFPRQVSPPVEVWQHRPAHPRGV